MFDNAETRQKLLRIPDLTFLQNKLFLERARIWIFSGICFVLPMKASFIYILSALLLLVWLAEGGVIERGKSIGRSRLCRAFIAYYLIFVVAMLWTEDVSAGWKMVDRQTPFLLFILYWSSAEPAYRERYISAFIAGLSLCALFAHYNFLQLSWFPEWPRGVRVLKGVSDTAPFVDWIMYSPILALGTYFSLGRVVSSFGTAKCVRATLVALLLLSNLSFAGGRAGIVMFLALCIALVFEKIAARRTALVVCAVLFPLIIYGAYKTSDLFASRIDHAITDIQTFDQNPSTSVGLRLVYWTTSFQLFIRNPVLGVGSGDFKNEYAKIKPERWRSTPDSYNPHNQFLLTAVTTGLMGLMALLYIFFSAATTSQDARTKSMLIGFAVVCMFESYFWRSNTALTFCVILAALSAGTKSEINT